MFQLYTKKYLNTAILICVLIIISLNYYNVMTSFGLSVRKHPVPEKSEFLILTWTERTTGNWNWFGKDDTGISSCSNLRKQCKYTNHRNNYLRADLVLFYMLHVATESDMPSALRPSSQFWMSYYREAQWRSAVTFMKDSFNATASFSRSTDLFLPYASYVETSRPGRQNLSGVERTRPVLWVVSHCSTSSRRERYVEELSRYVHVDVLGSCGDLAPCKRSDIPCENKHFAKYYFYLAFENSICEDYITEKVWSRMDNGMVPVVLGGGDYVRDLPPNSFIDITDFDSPRRLAAHLLALIDSPTEYEKLHAWRMTFSISHRNSLCAVCSFLNENEGHRKIIDDVNDVFSSSQCKNVSDYYAGSFDISGYD